MDGGEPVEPVVIEPLHRASPDPFVRGAHVDDPPVGPVGEPEDVVDGLGELPEPGLPFSLVFRAEPGMEDISLKVASAYEAASKRRIPPPDFGAL